MDDNMESSSNVVVFDPFAGASGDMVIGSLLSLGAGPSEIVEAMESAADVSVTVSEVKTGHIQAVRVEVVQNSSTSLEYHQMREQIHSAGLPAGVREDALGILELIGRAESGVHGTPLEELHLHETGQQDAIADIVGASTAFHALGLSRAQVFCMPVSVGGGYVDTAHGTLPVPAPATLAVLNVSNLVWRGGPVEHELLTPTGAAILAYFTQQYGAVCTVYPQMSSSATGYGAGSKDTGLPNVLRTVMGEMDPALTFDHIEMLETNVDDVTGEVLGYLVQELMDEGALDVSVIPATMKKGRSGSLIKVVCKVGDSHRLARRIMVETGSLGIRLIPVKHRLIARRSIMPVEIQVAGKPYTVRVKMACDTLGSILGISAEFEDCKQVAHSTGLQIKDIMRRAEEAARQQLELE
ncbi:MAG: nickel pincer cofactor biosynthesis protein LarC [ANME-2 cluster archaeon]|nr:nickel pincer cofactor biosynthesis protein LarC [ANME-2 cluster archaeon]